MVTQCVWNMKAILNSDFPKVENNGTWGHPCALVEKLKPIFISTPVQWTRPAPGWINISTDGSFTKTIRKFIFTFSILIQANNISQVEATIARFGIKWCTQHDHSNLYLEIDSL